MRAELDLRPVAYVFILLGILMAGMSAIIPHFDTGYRLTFTVLLVGLLPYVVYGALSEVLRGWSLLLPGILIVPAHVWLTVSERFLSFDGFQSGTIYVVPIILTVIVLPLAILAGRLLDSRTQPSGLPADQPPQAEAHRETDA